MARYGTGNPNDSSMTTVLPRVPQSMLAARRLIEAGVRVVTLNYEQMGLRGCPHNAIFNREKEDFPTLRPPLPQRPHQ
ncbi:MAG UNVERIFIED_CONTAM: DUF1501 domain-containing protein [Planctomycetaceae bacterium]